MKKIMTLFFVFEMLAFFSSIYLGSFTNSWSVVKIGFVFVPILLIQLVFIVFKPLRRTEVFILVTNIFSVVFVLFSFGCYFYNYFETRNLEVANKLVSTIYDYKSKTERFPDSLNMLQLNDIPKYRIGLELFDFEYKKMGSDNFGLFYSCDGGTADYFYYDTNKKWLYQD